MTEQVFKCPFCGDKESHHHLYVNQEKGVFYCQLCGASGSISYLLEKFPDFSIFFPGFFKKDTTNKYKSVSKFESLDITGRKGYFHQVVYEYLIYRGLNDNLIHRYKVMISSELPKYAIFPCGGNPKLFWCARCVDKESKLRWLFPPKNTTMFNKSESVWGIEFQKKKSEVWICEGIFDAAYTGGVAIFGKVPSNAQLRRILELHPSKIIVAFDNDAKVDAEKVRLKLASIIETEVILPSATTKDFGALLMKT